MTKQILVDDFFLEHCIIEYTFLNFSCESAHIVLTSVNVLDCFEDVCPSSEKN